MKWLKGNLFMTCLAVVAACLAFMSNGNVANAMTLQDLQGTYRIVDADTIWGDRAQGGLVELKYTEDGLVGIGKNNPDDGFGFRSGDEVIYDVWIDEGKINCKVSYSRASQGWVSTMEVYNNGATIKLTQNGKEKPLFWVMKKVG